VRYLILSDIHANLPALEAVLADAAGAYDVVACCGDLIGYGADPNAVVDWARQTAKVVVRGNHDKACKATAEELEWFNPTAREAAEWTQQTLHPHNIEYLASLPRGPVSENGFQLLHGSPVDEDEYVISTWDAAPLSGYVDGSLAFFGHTHLQGGFFFPRAGVQRLPRPPRGETELVLNLTGDRLYLVNPGSVGQPRDADPRAAYVLYDPDYRTVLYRRVEYDIADAQKRIRQAGLPDGLASRLRTGT
jgi:predicted phosphodiesterase